MIDYLCIGDIKLDTFLFLPPTSGRIERSRDTSHLCVEYGAKIPVETTQPEIAGSAPNVAVGLSRLEIKSGIFSTMGKDEIFDQAIKHLKKEKVDTSTIFSSKMIRSASSVILNYQDDRTVFASHPDVVVSQKTFPKSKGIFIGEMGKNSDLLFHHLDKHIENSKDLFIAFNPGSIQLKERSHELFTLLEKTSILFLNKQEAQQLTKLQTEDVKALLSRLLKFGCKQAVMTDGKNGSFFLQEETFHHCPAVSAAVKSTIGAGDAFISGFLFGLSEKGKIHPLVYGAVNSASVVSQISPQIGLLTKSELQKRAKMNANILK